MGKKRVGETETEDQKQEVVFTEDDNKKLSIEKIIVVDKKTKTETTFNRGESGISDLSVSKEEVEDGEDKYYFNKGNTLQKRLDNIKEL